MKKTLRQRGKPFVVGMSEVNQMIVKVCRGWSGLQAGPGRTLHPSPIALFLRPECPIQRAVLDRLGNVLGLDRLSTL